VIYQQEILIRVIEMRARTLLESLNAAIAIPFLRAM